MHYPRIIIAALKGGSGKTILSLGLTAAWREQGRVVAPFKKGPDFIDAGWLDFAAGRPCYNLDPFLMSEKEIRESFFTHSSGADISLIEGNRGLYDGLDIDGCCSTSELGKMLKAPVIIIADVTMSTRTIAAVILAALPGTGRRVGGLVSAWFFRLFLRIYPDLCSLLDNGGPSGVTINR